MNFFNNGISYKTIKNNKTLSGFFKKKEEEKEDKD